MTADHEQARNTDRTRRGTNAFIGGVAGVMVTAVLVSLADPGAGGGFVVAVALVVGLIGAVIGWAVPKAG